MSLPVFLRSCLLALLLALAPGFALAFGTTQCAGSRFGSDLNCTANDVSITSIEVVGGSTSCTPGQTLTLDLKATVRFASPDRWDIGIFISNDGRDGQLTPANGGATSCSVAILPTTSPFLNLDPGPHSGVTDTCGDGNGTINGGGGAGTGDVYMYGVQVPCQALANSGKLYIPFVVSWDNQSSPSGNTCQTIADPVPNTKSKCNAPTIEQGSVNVYVFPSISKTNGITSITPGDTTTYTITIGNTTGLLFNTASGNAVIFKDPAVANLTVSSVSCSASGGATCPSSGSTTVAAMQGASGITIPSMPASSTVVFTVNATLSNNPTGSLTNVATITTQTATSSLSAIDSDAIVYPSLTHLKTASIISDPINGTSNPKAIPGAEALYTLTVTNSGLGTVNSNVMFITDPIPANTRLFVGNLGGSPAGPVTFTQGAVSSNLTFGYTSLASTTDDVEFSGDNGSSWTPTITFDGNGYATSTITHIRFNPKGKMAAWSGTGTQPSFSLGFKIKIN